MKSFNIFKTIKNAVMNYYNTRDSRWFKKRLVRVKYYRCNSSIAVKFKDNTGGMISDVEVKNRHEK